MTDDGYTTIRIHDDTHARLNSLKTGGESFDQAVRRALNDSAGVLWTEEEVRDLIRDELERMQRSGPP